MLYSRLGRPALPQDQEVNSQIIEAKWAAAKSNNHLYSDVDFENGFLNPKGKWMEGEGIQENVPEIGWVFTAPMDWGNISMFPANRYGEAKRLVNSPDWGLEKAQGLAENRFFRVKGKGDAATILTLSQVR